MLENRAKPYPVKLMLPFGCLVIVRQPKAQRKVSKQPNQPAAWPGIFIGYGDDMGYGGSYLIFDGTKKEVKLVSVNYCVADESNYPWKSHPALNQERKKHPLFYSPTLEAVLDS